MQVYLAGQITDDKSTLLWRQEAERVLTNAGFEIRSPLRGKDALWDDALFKSSKGMQATNLSAKSIILRDYRDVEGADLILVNMYPYDKERGLQGTLFELAWAWMLNIPVIAYGLTRDQRRHPFLRESITEDHIRLEAALRSIRTYWAETTVPRKDPVGTIEEEAFKNPDLPDLPAGFPVGFTVTGDAKR